MASSRTPRRGVPTTCWENWAFACALVILTGLGIVAENYLTGLANDLQCVRLEAKCRYSAGRSKAGISSR